MHKNSYLLAISKHSDSSIRYTEPNLLIERDISAVFI